MFNKYLVYSISELKMWFWAFLSLIPGFTGCLLRSVYLNKNAKRFMVWGNVTIEYLGNLTVGTNVSVNKGSVINCGGGVSISNDALIGPGAVIYSQNHNYSKRNEVICKQGYSKTAVVIEGDFWVAAGVKLKQGCVVAAGAIVTKVKEEHGVYAGIPAKLISKRV